MLQFSHRKQSTFFKLYATADCFDFFGGFKSSANVKRIKLLFRSTQFVSLLCHGCAVKIVNRVWSANYFRFALIKKYSRKSDQGKKCRKESQNGCQDEKFSGLLNFITKIKMQLKKMNMKSNKWNRKCTKRDQKVVNSYRYVRKSFHFPPNRWNVYQYSSITTSYHVQENLEKNSHWSIDSWSASTMYEIVGVILIRWRSFSKYFPNF